MPGPERDTSLVLIVIKVTDWAPVEGVPDSVRTGVSGLQRPGQAGTITIPFYRSHPRKQ